MKRILSLFILYWLRFFAKLKLSQINPIIIGVTGSAGKTSCVAAIEAILQEKYRVRATGGANSESGVPLAILGLRMNDYSPLDWLRVLLLSPISLIAPTSPYDILVAEMGVDELTPPKNMEYLLTIIKPKIGVFLNVLPVHTQQMKSLEKIAAEKGKLITSLPVEGTAVLNTDDPRVAAFAAKTRAKVEFFPAPVPVLTGSDPVSSTFAAAAAVGKVLGIPPAESKKYLAKNFKLPPGRGTILKGINGSTLIDSSYNASPATVLSSLGLLATFTRGGLANGAVKRRVTVLGDMRELGDPAERFHRQVAQKASETADAVITVGPLTKQYFPRHKKLIAQFNNSYKAGQFLRKYLHKGDLVLFKGSQNTIFLETAVEMVLENPADIALLCRRGKFWDRQREKYR